MSILPVYGQVDSVKFHKDLDAAMDSLYRRQVGNLDKELDLKIALVSAVDDVFALDPFNHMAFSRLEHFMENKEIDSLCNKLKERFPNSVQPYLLSAYYSKPKTEDQVEEIAKGLQINDSSFQLNMYISYLYYSLYLKNASKYAKLCLEYSKKTMALDTILGNDMKYFIAQIGQYLGLNNANILNVMQSASVQPYIRPRNYQRYFRTEDLIELKDNWLLDSSYDVAHPIDMANFSNRWYSSQLYAMEEPIIYNIDKNETYRFTWLRSFHNPVAIRTYTKDGKYFISWKKCDGAGGYSPGKLEIDKTKELTNSEWLKLKELLATANFWKLTKEKKVGLDGAQWLFEGNISGNYHFVERWTAKESEIGKVGLFLLNLTDLDLNPKTIY